MSGDRLAVRLFAGVTAGFALLQVGTLWSGALGVALSVRDARRSEAQEQGLEEDREGS